MHRAAEHAIPVVAELSGCDAVVVLESADTARVVDAVAFGMRLNGSATCIAPRRLFLVGHEHHALIAALRERFAAIDGIDAGQHTRNQLRDLLEDAEQRGATLCGNAGAQDMRPILVLDGRPDMRITQADIFAPVVTAMSVANADEVAQADAICPFGLTVAIFGERRAALELGRRLNVGTVILNDLIVPTVDPRVPFGGVRGSGFGVTRGAEGLLEMTAVKVTSIRKGTSTLHYQQTGTAHEELFRGAIAMGHAANLRERFAGLRRMIAAARKLG
jgi:aldehyde dehydrogenase (NAD+)